MTLVLPDRDRLVAPHDLVAMPPLSFTSEELPALPFVFEPSDETVLPSHVATSRALADEYGESPTAAARLAQAEQSIGEDERAIAAARRVLALVEKQPDTAATAAAIQVLIGSDSLDDAWRALELLPDSSVRGMLGARLAVHRGDLEAASEWLDELDGFDVLAMKGWLYLQRAEWPQAIHALRRAINASDRPTPGVLVNLGYAYAALGSLEKAVRATKQALLLNPDSHLITFNLVAFHRACGDFEAAEKEIKDLQQRHPHDLRIHFAEADLRLTAGDIQGAQKVLRRARTSSLWASAGTIQRAELVANLAFVAWRAGDQPRETARAIVIEELERTEYRSLEIASMLPSLMTSTDDADQLARLLSSLEETNPGQPLDFLPVHLASLRCDFDAATKLATDYARRDIFNPIAAAHAIYLLADVWGDYDTAIEIGYSTIKRVPSSAELRNNLAYVLALANRLREAREVLPDAIDESVYFSATAALIDLLSGRIDEGVAGYRHAHELAKKATDARLASLVMLNMLLAFHRLVKRQPIEGVYFPPISLPPGWEHDPRFVLIARVVEREQLPAEEH
jgi:tetratricopeptide (TPR) repeat protein